MTTPEQIDRWRQCASEDQHLEFKAARLQFDHRRLLQYCIALANEGGGRLVLGIADAPPRAVVGTQACRDPIGMAEKLHATLGFRVDVEEVRHPDGRVVVLHVPGRPRGTALHLDGAYLMRSGEALVPMSEDMLRRIFAEGEPDWLEQPSQTGLTAAEVVARLDTQSYFELLRLPYPVTQDGVIDRLCSARMVDRQEDRFAIRRLGALLLCKRLDDFPELARKAARVVVYSGSSKIDTRLDQTWTRGYAVGFAELVAFVMAQLPQHEVIEAALRKQARLLPEVVVRELVANALIHQDLSVRGAAVMIEIFDRRVEISNPGLPIVPVERFIDGYQSRNERLADAMRQLHICEEKSSGIDKVVLAVEANRLPAPDFRAAHQRTLVVVQGPKEFAAMDRIERQRCCYQHCAVHWVAWRPMTNKSLRERFRLAERHRPAVSHVISGAIAVGLIKPDSRERSRKLAQYVPFWA